MNLPGVCLHDWPVAAQFQLNIFLSVEIASGVESVCSEYDYVVLVGYSDRDPVKEKNILLVLRAGQVDGVIILPGSEPLVFAPASTAKTAHCIYRELTRCRA